jgi:hypothetical protein
VPVERDGNGPTDPVIHLQAYGITASKVCMDTAGRAPRPTTAHPA